MIILTYSLLYSKLNPTALIILGLSLGLTLEDNLLRQIIIISAIVVYLLSNIDSDTAYLFFLGLIGLMILVEGEELIIIYLSVELVSLSFYILAARERHGIKSTEAGIKYWILGALTSGILLMGITLVYCKTGTTDLELIDPTSRLLIVIGFLFKLGAAPFHIWVPDIYEGSATIVTAFFAIVPKLAYLGVLMKLAGGESYLIIGILSIMVGSLAAINQTKIKRFLAYSAIAHVGFMLLGIGVNTYMGIQATIVYMILYIIMTINTFSIVINYDFLFLSELRGLSRHNPILAISFGLLLMSIAGVPPLGGFYNKYLILLSVVEHKDYIFAIIAILLSVISSFYYLRIIRYMFFFDAPEITIRTKKIQPFIAIILGITTYLIITIMFNPSILLDLSLPNLI